MKKDFKVRQTNKEEKEDDVDDKEGKYDEETSFEEKKTTRKINK